MISQKEREMDEKDIKSIDSIMDNLKELLKHLYTSSFFVSSLRLSSQASLQTSSTTSCLNLTSPPSFVIIYVTSCFFNCSVMIISGNCSEPFGFIRLLYLYLSAFIILPFFMSRYDERFT